MMPKNIPNTKNNKGHHVDKGTKEHLGVMALIAIMEPATESQTSRVNKQPLKVHPSNKISFDVLGNEKSK